MLKAAAVNALEATKTDALKEKPARASSYAIFASEHYPQFKAVNPSAAFGDIEKLVLQKWKDLSDIEKDVRFTCSRLINAL